MLPFTLERAATPANASRLLAQSSTGTTVQGRVPSEFLAGGTTLLDLMKLEAMAPSHVVDVGPLRRDYATISATPDGLRLGAFASMAEAARHSAIVQFYPVLSQSLLLAASAQLRNMATLGRQCSSANPLYLFPRRELGGLQQAQSWLGMRGARRR